MITIHELCESSGESLHTIQYWRKLNLLPEPVGVRKRVILFDESVLDRIKWLRKKQSEGMSLDEIGKHLEEQATKEPVVDKHGFASAEEKLKALDTDIEKHQLQIEVLQVKLNELEAYANKWTEKKGFKGDICKVLTLDPSLTGNPVIFTAPQTTEQEESILPLKVYVSVPSAENIVFAEVDVEIYKEPVLIRKEVVDGKIYGMVLYLMGSLKAQSGEILDTSRVPFWLFTHTGALNFNTVVSMARTTLRLVDMGIEFQEFLKKHQ